MADLQHQAALFRQGAEFIRLCQSGGNRLFDQHVFAGVEGLGSQLIMNLGRGGDDQRIRYVEQILEADLLRAGLPTHGLCPFQVGIEDAGQMATAGCGDLQRVVAAEVARARDTDPKH